MVPSKMLHVAPVPIVTTRSQMSCYISAWTTEGSTRSLSRNGTLYLPFVSNLLSLNFRQPRSSSKLSHPCTSHIRYQLVGLRLPPCGLQHYSNQPSRLDLSYCGLQHYLVDPNNLTADSNASLQTPPSNLRTPPTPLRTLAD